MHEGIGEGVNNINRVIGFNMVNEILIKLCSGLPLNPLPSSKKSRNLDVPHAPDRKPLLTNDERKVIQLSFEKFKIRSFF
jgi:hypothetical protein